MGKGGIDTRAIGLDAGLGFVSWLTGAENLHYGFWDGLEVTAANLGPAQMAYTARLFGYLPDGPLRILDIGGGAGETARKLIALGHEVEIVVPSALLAERCRVNAPLAKVHEATFEDVEAVGDFDLCLFSESFQYIPMDLALTKARRLLKPGGHILIADCFRSEDFSPDGRVRIAGGGHPVAEFRSAPDRHGLRLVRDEDVTVSVAPSIDLEQALFHVIGKAVDRIDRDLKENKPASRWMVATAMRALMGTRKLRRLNTRLRGNERTSEAFLRNNRYLIALLAREETSAESGQNHGDED